MFLLSRTGCELQRTGLLQWPSPGSMLGWESQRGEKILENCCGTGPVDVTFPAPLVQEVGAGHRLQARNMLMLIYGSSRRRGICLLHIQVSHLWAITPTQVWGDAKKKYSKPFLLNFRVRDYQLPWKCHTYKKNFVHHILLEEKLSASHYTCVYPAQVWDQIGSAHLSCLIGYNYWLPAILCFIGILFCRGIWIWQTAASSAAMFWFSWTAEKGQCTHQSLCSLFFKGAEIQRACLQRALFSAVAGASCLIGRGISVWPLFIFH